MSQTHYRLTDVMVVAKVRHRPWSRRPVRMSVMALAVGVAVGVVGVTATKSYAASAPAAAPAVSAIPATPADCPTGADELPPDAVARAADAALAAVPKLYDPEDTAGAQVTASTRATSSPRGAQVEDTCGAQARERTVEVAFLFPELLPSASLSQGVVFVARFGDDYRVWRVVR